MNQILNLTIQTAVHLTRTISMIIVMDMETKMEMKMSSLKMT